MYKVVVKASGPNCFQFNEFIRSRYNCLAKYKLTEVGGPDLFDLDPIISTVGGITGYNGVY